MRSWLARAKAGAVLLGAVVVVQLAISSGYATALDSAVMSRLPVAVVGPSAVTARLAAAAGSRLDLRPAGSDAEAASQIRSREVYGAVLLDTHRLLVAGAAGVPAAQALTKAFPSFPATDIVPLPAGDPHGSGPAMAVIAWALGGYLGAMLLGRVGGMRMRSFRQIGVRLLVLGGYAVASAAALAAVLDGGLGVLTGHPLAVIGTGALFVFAVGCLTTMLQSVLRLAGVLVSILIIIMLGNPSAAGGQTPPQMMNAFWRAINPVMPNPAAMNALRDYQSFGGHAVGAPLLTMVLWAVVPVVIMGTLALSRRVPADGASGREADLTEASGAALAAGGAT
jgi:hypothetical protein